MSTAPQFVSTVNKGTPGTLTAANTNMDGTGATGRLLAFTAGANGSLLPSILYYHKGTNSTAVVMRVWRNNGSDPEVAGNNTLINETAMAANTISQTAVSVPGTATLNVKLAGGANPERIYVTLSGTATAGIHVTPYNGGDF